MGSAETPLDLRSYVSWRLIVIQFHFSMSPNYKTLVKETSALARVHALFCQEVVDFCVFIVSVYNRKLVDNLLTSKPQAFQLVVCR